MSITSTSAFAATGNPFRDYCGKVLEDMCREHDREVAAMYNDNLMIRKELSRVADLLASSVEREKELHRVSDMLQSVFHQSISQMGAHSAAAQHASNMHGGKKASMLDPLQATQQELARIKQILSAPPVPPPSVSAPTMAYTGSPTMLPQRSGIPTTFFVETPAYMPTSDRYVLETPAYMPTSDRYAPTAVVTTPPILTGPPVATSSAAYIGSTMQPYIASPVQSYVPPVAVTTSRW